MPAALRGVQGSGVWETLYSHHDQLFADKVSHERADMATWLCTLLLLLLLAIRPASLSVAAEGLVGCSSNSPVTVDVM